MIITNFEIFHSITPVLLTGIPHENVISHMHVLSGIKNNPPAVTQYMENYGLKVFIVYVSTCCDAWDDENILSQVKGHLL